jgi:sporulation protein YlmC with PRC-barrel domain
MWSSEQLESWIGKEAIDSEGQKVGLIRNIYLDDTTGDPEWVAVTTGLFGRRMSFSPMLDAKEDGEHIQLAHKKSLIKDSPNVDDDGDLSIEDERRLYSHYGLSYSTPMSEAGSAEVGSEVTPEIARRRLRRRNEVDVDFIDLDGTNDQAVSSTQRS